jgi:hypothetical protein
MNAQAMINRQPARWLAPAPNPDVFGMGGAQAGLAGGIAMTLSAALLAGVKGYDIWFQLKSIASLVLGPAAIAQAGFVAGPVLIGLAIHLAISALLGAIFGIGMRQVLRLPSDFGVPVVAGLVFGLLLWLAAFLALPALLPQLIAVYAPAFIIQHIVYGTVTGLVYGVVRPQPYVMFN